VSRVVPARTGGVLGVLAGVAMALVACARPAPDSPAGRTEAFAARLAGNPQSWRLSCESRSAADLLAAHGLPGTEAEVFARLPRSDNPDLGFVGDIEDIDTALIELLLSRQFVPVIMPIGVAADGTAYHINSDLLAGRLARVLEAEKLILMTNVPGVHDRDGKLAHILTASEAEAWLATGVVQGGMVPRVAAALRAVREGVRSVHIIDGGVPSALLLEVLTAEGVGTALRSDAGPHFFADSKAYLLAK
jgi:acetylglutamate kinase